MITVLVSKTFQKQFKKIPIYDSKYILEKIQFFCNGNKNIDIKKLNPKHLNYYRLRSGKYRIIFYYSDLKEITLLKIDKRDSIYFNV